MSKSLTKSKPRRKLNWFIAQNVVHSTLTAQPTARTAEPHYTALKADPTIRDMNGEDITGKHTATTEEVAVSDSYSLEQLSF